MSKVTYRLNNKTSVHAEGEAQDIIKQISAVSELFADHECGQCQGQNLQYVHRTAEGYDFYELVCKDCWAKLTFGTSQGDKKLYARRYVIETEGKNKGKAKRDANDKAIPLGKNGWTKYNKETGENE